MNSVCPALYFNLDFKATIEKHHINKAELFYKPSNDSVKMAVISLRVRKVGLAALKKTNCVCRFYLKLNLQCKRLTTNLQDYHFHRCYRCANVDFKATTGNFTSFRIVLPKMAKWRCISVGKLAW